MPNSPDSEALLTTKQIAAKIGVTPQTIRKWMRDELIPCRRITVKSIWFIESEVRAAMKNWNGRKEA